VSDLEVHRKHYAQLVTAMGGAGGNNDLISAFTTVRREDYLGSGPWKVRTGNNYIVTPTEDPTFVYQDVLVALKSEENLNNGQPSMHAAFLNALGVSVGNVVIHIGTGTGYYTAILAELVGSSGMVYGYEIDEELALLASENLRDRNNVEIRNSSGVLSELPRCDVIYVNAGVTEPVSVWLDALKEKGNLLFPLTSSRGTGGMLFIQRIAIDSYSAKFISSVGFIDCVGAREDKTAIELNDKFKQGNAREVRSFQRYSSPDESCWFKWEKYWLSTNSVEEPK